MNPESDRDIFEENLQRLLQAGAREECSDFQERLVRVVRQEVSVQRRAGRKILLWAGLPATAAAAAVLVLAWVLLNPAAQSIDWVQPLYGGVEIIGGAAARPVAASEPVRTGQSIRTLSGSKAQLLMQDGSRLTVMPRSTVQITDGKKGSTFKLQAGTVNIEAAKQRRGRALAVETTPGARVRTLGTVFNVRLVKRPDGTRQTRVGVTSGLVEFESGGNKVLLGAHTEGVADEGQTPRKHLADSDLDEVLRLLDKTATLAGQLGKAAGAPCILELQDASTVAVWTVVSLDKFQKAEKYSLRLKSPAAKARLFTLDGLEIPVGQQGRDLTIDSSAVSPGLSTDTRLILQLQEVKGILRAENGEVVRFARPAGPSDAVTLFQFRLPGQARIEHVTPEPIETTTMLDRTVITIAVNVQGLEVWD
jgi:ferric-dicitrate binding protein FerR (iron transport regulator)